MNVIFASTVAGLLLFVIMVAVQEFRYWLEDRAWARKADYTLQSAQLPLKSSEKDHTDRDSVID